jgi:mannose-6-phosphate isomerase
MADHGQNQRGARAGALRNRQPSRGGGAAARRLVGWMQQDALPLWLRRGWDTRRGGFHERLFFDGAPDDLVRRRVRVQWRQIYVLAHASELGWTDGLKLAFQGLEHVLQRAWAPDGAPGFVHVLEPDGSVAAAKRDAYDHAFAILALAWLAKASGDAQVRALLDLVMNFVENALTDPDGFLRESIPDSKPHRQNTHMHMLEAMLAALETVDHPDAAARATRYRRMLEKTFIDRESGLLVEYFDDSWRPVLEDDAAIVEPGHMAEWVWLIRKYERLLGQKASPLGTHLLGAALRAAEPETGFLIDEIDTALSIRLATRRLWPQTELIKAWLAQAETGADRAEDAAEALIERLLATYLSGPFSGGWFDKYDATGKVQIDTVPASSLYHVFVAAAETERVLGS